MDSIQVSIALQSIPTIQSIQGPCNSLLHGHNNPKMCIFFLQIWIQCLKKFNESIEFHLSSLSELFLHRWTQQQTAHKSKHMCLTSYAHLFIIDFICLTNPNTKTLKKQAKNSKLLPLKLQNQVMNVLQHAPQACTKPIITLKANQVSSTSTPLKPCLLKVKVKTKTKKRREDEEGGRRIEHNIVIFFLSKMSFLDIYINN